MFIDLTTDLNWIRAYRLCIGFINPRPIALVSTVWTNGSPNLAPFSFYNMVSGNPPIVMFCPSLKRDGEPKDSLRNVEATGEFVVATATAAIARQMVDCAAALPHGRSEFAFSGLTPAPARLVRPPLVSESPVNIECKLHQIVPLGDGPGSTRVVFGRIVAIHLDDALLDEGGAIDPHRLQTVGRLGGQWYCDVTVPYEMQIPAV